MLVSHKLKQNIVKKQDFAQDNLRYPRAKSLFWVIISAFLFSSSFYPLENFPAIIRYLNYFCISPFFLELFLLVKIENFRRRMFHYFILITTFSLTLEIIAFSWVYTSIKYFFHTNHLITSIIYLILAFLSFPYYFLLFSPVLLLNRKFKVYKINWYSIICLTFLIVNIEYYYPKLAPWFFGYSYFYDSNLRKLGSILGSIGLSFLFFYSNILLAIILFRKIYLKLSLIDYVRNKFFYHYLFFIFAILFFKLKSSEKNPSIDQKINIGYIQPNFSVIHDKDIGGVKLKEKSLFELVKKFDKVPIELIIVPESAIYYQFGNFPEKIEDIYLLAKSASKPILLQSVIEINDAAKTKSILKIAESRSFIVYPDGKTSTYYVKWNLMPFGEEFPLSKYIPFLEEFYLKWTKQDVILAPGNQANTLLFQNIKIGIFICYDSIDKNLVHNLVQNGAQFLVNQANFIWMSDTNAIFVYSIINQFKAIESQRSLLFLTNNGPTQLFDKNGNLVFSNKVINKQDLSVLSIPLNNNLSIFTEFNLLVKLAFIVATILSLFVFFIKKL
ncbi:apolipoprotein N-acyltransferase [Pigmentibacter ruber]